MKQGGEKNLRIIEEYKKYGQSWLNGNDIVDWQIGDGKKFEFSEKQKQFINSRKRYCLFSGGFGSGKSLALLIKMIFFCLFFPDNQVLLGRKTLMDIQRTTLPDLFELLPQSWYHYKVKEGIITFFNNSKIILFGLDTLQEGAISDIKKAQQKVKSLNLGAYFIDQLEEIEKPVFESLNARLRRMEVPLQQGNMTTNPANYWAYSHFKKNPDEEKIALIEGSMLDNKENLPEAYIQDQLDHDENYVKRFVYGIWTPDVLTDKAVFAEEYIKRFELLKKSPIATEEGCEIFEEFKQGSKYQMGVDPSTGAVDSTSISVINIENGEKVAKFNGRMSVPASIEKTKLLYYKYGKPLIVPEINGVGVALLEGIKDLNVYQREVFETYEKGEKIKKLGWKTTHSTKLALVAHFQELLRKKFPKIYDEGTIEELKTFIWSDEAKKQGAGAQRHFHDDDVMSTLLAFWGIKAKSEEVWKLEKRLEEAVRYRQREFEYF